MIWYAVAAILAVLLFFYAILELHYFIRSCFCVLSAKICKKKVHILDETRVTGLCLTTDIDNLLTHMNNARFIRELDFAKIDFYQRTGLYRKICDKGGDLVVGATTIRYRRFIKLFSRYVITTKIIYWDQKNIYMEHRFLTTADNFINAIVLCKTRITNCSIDEVINELMMEIASNSDIEIAKTKKEKPEMSLELQKWIESNEISSANLRNLQQIEASQYKV